MKRALTLGTLWVAGLSARATVARACVWEPVALHHSDHALAQSDTLAPSPPVVLNVDVTRRSGQTCVHDTCVQNSCGDTGMVRLELAPGLDDQTPPDQIGYRLELVSGSLPESLRSLTGVDLAARTPLFLRVGFEEAAALDATLRVVAVDAAGNASAPSDPFVLAFDGCTLAATGDACEDEFVPEAAETGQAAQAGEAAARAAQTERAEVDPFSSVATQPAAPPRSSSCSVPVGSQPSSVYAAIALGMFGLLALRRQCRDAG